jgi:hypothetical protein
MNTVTHWKKLTNPDYLGAYALDPGQDLIVTIDYVKNETVTGTDGKKENCSVIHFTEKNVKPMIMNATNAKTITKLFKTPYVEQWHGRKIQIFVDTVKAFGEMVEALRIRPEIPKEAEYYCYDCNSLIVPVGNKSAEWLARYTQGKYGRPLCSECATNAANNAVKDEGVL